MRGPHPSPLVKIEGGASLSDGGTGGDGGQDVESAVKVVPLLAKPGLVLQNPKFGLSQKSEIKYFDN